MDLWLNYVMRIKLLGLGHSMRGDDEIGLIVVQRWTDEYGDSYSEDQVEADVLESPGLNLLGNISGWDAAVLVDAVQSGTPAGTVHILAEEDLATFADGSGSAHGWGAAETLSLGHQLVPEDMPPKIILIGIEAVQFELGEGLSPGVKIAIPRAVDAINQEIKRLIRGQFFFWRLLRIFKR
jgi:hydrogenase maturation protease